MQQLESLRTATCAHVASFSFVVVVVAQVYTGEPGVEATATAPQSLLTGMNQFLQQLRVTFRRDPTNFRPRINKPNSQKDKEQKLSGNFFFMDADDDEDI
jgi:ATP-binding cassette subfamily E protein 1